MAVWRSDGAALSGAFGEGSLRTGVEHTPEGRKAHLEYTCMYINTWWVLMYGILYTVFYTNLHHY